MYFFIKSFGGLELFILTLRQKRRDVFLGTLKLSTMKTLKFIERIKSPFVNDELNAVLTINLVWLHLFLRVSLWHGELLLTSSVKLKKRMRSLGVALRLERYRDIFD